MDAVKLRTNLFRKAHLLRQVYPITQQCWGFQASTLRRGSLGNHFKGSAHCHEGSHAGSKREQTSQNESRRSEPSQILKFDDENSLVPTHMSKTTRATTTTTNSSQLYSRSGKRTVVRRKHDSRLQHMEYSTLQQVNTASISKSENTPYFNNTEKQQVKDSNTLGASSIPLYGMSPKEAKIQAKLARKMWEGFDPIVLRDSCICPKCVDPSTKQKNFATTDIPESISVKESKVLPNGTTEIQWENDIEGFSEPGEVHATILPEHYFAIHNGIATISADRHGNLEPRHWWRKRITNELQYVEYEQYMTTDEVLYLALRQLVKHGLLLVRGVPDSEEAVENIASRIGNLRDSLYGRTWDVRSIPEAKNVAYTSQFLGLHMDLLYMANPPGLQLLHCLKNTCEGGHSLFADTFNAAYRVTAGERSTLSSYRIPYHYRNAGEHYYYDHPVLELSNRHAKILDAVNFSPPFQAPLREIKEWSLSLRQKGGVPGFRHFFSAFSRFIQVLESNKNLFEYKLQAGECVIFNNRRVVHGRRQFDAGNGERWLKGAYVDTDVWRSRYNVLREKTERMELFVNRPQYPRLLVNPPNYSQDEDELESDTDDDDDDKRETGFKTEYRTENGFRVDD